MSSLVFGQILIRRVSLVQDIVFRCAFELMRNAMIHMCVCATEYHA